MSLIYVHQGFETRTRPYGPTGKLRTVHFCDSFGLKNCSMGKKQGPMRTAVGPHSSKSRD